MTKAEIKERNLDTLAEYRDKLRKKPELRQLFLELTLKCNENCFHCGSRCSAQMPHGLELEQYKSLLDEVKENFGTKLMIALTGGEPLLYPKFFDLVEYIRSLGFPWGMTSNGTLITKDTARRLKECGMRTISVSIDGVRDTHNRYRKMERGYELAMRGIQNLIDLNSFDSIMVTTVVNHENISELDELFEIFNDMDINEWRLTGLEPIGRAMEAANMQLTPTDYRILMEFIRDKREQKLPVEYSCSHFLGLEYEADVRDWYFLCNAGVYVAGIMVNGAVGACLDIPRNERTVQGNIFQDNFTDIWKNCFEIFRTLLSERNSRCTHCPQSRWCEGGSYHSWDYEKDEPKVCFKDILF